MLASDGSDSDSFTPGEDSDSFHDRKSKNKGRSKFSAQEDEILRSAVQIYGAENWSEVARFVKSRTQRQCRDRWNNYLSPGANLSEWTSGEEELLERMVSVYGHHWSLIAKSIPGRTAASIRNRYIKLDRLRQRQKILIKPSIRPGSTPIVNSSNQRLVFSPLQPQNNPVVSSPSLPEITQENTHHKTQKVVLPSISNFPFSAKK